MVNRNGTFTIATYIDLYGAVKDIKQYSQATTTGRGHLIVSHDKMFFHTQSHHGRASWSVEPRIVAAHGRRLICIVLSRIQRYILYKSILSK